MNTDLQKKRSCISCLKSLLIVVNCFLMLLGIAIAGVFIWMAVDQVYPVKGVTGNDLVMISTGLLITAGILLVLSTCIGISAAAAEHFVLTLTYITMLFLVLLLFVAGAVCVSVFKAMLTEPVKLHMEDLIRKTYGVHLENGWNSQVTKSWDAAQNKWQCCSAADKSWALYQESDWRYRVVGTEQNKNKPYVPESCCERHSNGEFKDRDKCLHSPPPKIGDQYPGEPAPVYQRGCYEMLKDYFLADQLSWFTGILWVGVGGALLMVLMLLISVPFSFQVRREYKLQRLRSVDFEFLSKPSGASHMVMNSPSYQSTSIPDSSLSLRQTAPNQYMYSMA